jgi:hypothetical protein
VIDILYWDVILAESLESEYFAKIVQPMKLLVSKTGTPAIEAKLGAITSSSHIGLLTVWFTSNVTHLPYNDQLIWFPTFRTHAFWVLERLLWWCCASGWREWAPLTTSKWVLGYNMERVICPWVQPNLQGSMHEQLNQTSSKNHTMDSAYHMAPYIK